MSKSEKIKKISDATETGELKMTTFYEYHAKVGTTSHTLVWLINNPVAGEQVYGICEESQHSPYKESHDFRYAPMIILKVEKIIPWTENEELLILSYISRW